ncbi:MAG: 23S rRNA (uridine(2552)-2'-O)-methyltransferase RlmE [Pseudomonadales bacterium]|nr:23S rRNA (uridine(2552)-2'-O)-methyltransferase RlmE [Pseudomonadales bacterium]
MAKKSKSSGRWLDEHFSDHYVKQSQRLGYRSRACFKLLEIQEKDHILQPNMTVIDLGSAPGGWSQVCAEFVGPDGLIIASDILPMDALADVTFVQGDFTEDKVFEEILAAVNNRPVDLVISDMAPNMSGMSDIDQPKAMYLVELALDLAKQVLKPDGVFLAKVFQGEGFEPLVQDIRSNFRQMITRKPQSSRARSRETYLLGKGFKG